MKLIFVNLPQMIAIQFHERVIHFKDWATILFVLSFLVIGVNKNVFQARFTEFIKLAVSDKNVDAPCTQYADYFLNFDGNDVEGISILKFIKTRVI